MFVAPVVSHAENNEPVTQVQYAVEQNGWVQKDGKWYYYENGQMHRGFLEYNGKTYWMGPDGTMMTGYLTFHDRSYVFAEDGAMYIEAGWVLSGGEWYFVLQGGELLADGFLQEGDKTYWFGENGKLKSG